MKFKRLDLNGFKSFVEKTSITIDKGLTGIVGPNGCGKSNIVEAIKWCMGETSAKSMRGSGMEDVIFSGTANKASKNIAEVSLTLDNCEKEGPLQFKELDIINVKRRIVKDKGSRYFINEKEMRGRDIQTLFAEVSPIHHLIASTIFDLPQPLGPTIPVKPFSITIEVFSINDLKPVRSSLLNFMC